MATWKFHIAAERLAQLLGTIYKQFLTVVSVSYNFMCVLYNTWILNLHLPVTPPKNMLHLYIDIPVRFATLLLWSSHSIYIMGWLKPWEWLTSSLSCVMGSTALSTGLPSKYNSWSTCPPAAAAAYIQSSRSPFFLYNEHYTKTSQH